MKTLIFIFSCFFLFSFSFSISNSASYNLFHIGRSRDKNIIKYDINIRSNGTINALDPVKIYWIKYTDKNRIEGLSYIQNKLAYGIDFVSIQANEVKFKFVSYGKRTFTIKKNNKGKYRVFSEYKSKQVEVSDIFIQIDGGTFMIPKISYVKLHWKDNVSENEGDEYIKP